jgi:SAM-dependent methyltransferase
VSSPVAYPFKPFPGSSHSWALDEASRLPPGPLKVLDVGAGEGHVLSALRELRADPVSAVAVEPASRRDAGEGSSTWVRDLTDVHDAGFDLALLLDVLEHVPDPAVTLSVVASKLRPGGSLLVSVPNVAHWSVRASLLAGRFDYTDRGILDRTHLRFFTQSTLLDLLESTGCTVEATSQSLVPLELLLPEEITATSLWSAATTARKLFARAMPGLLAYQLLVRATV